MAKGKSLRALCSLCRCEKNQKGAHRGTASTAQNGEVREMAKAKVSGRCGRCVAVRKKKKKVSHGGTASTARKGEGARDGEGKVSGRCGRCVAVRKKEEEGGSRRHSVHSAEWIGTRIWRKQKPPGAVFAVSL